MAAAGQSMPALPDGLDVLQNIEFLAIKAIGSRWDGTSTYAVINDNHDDSHVSTFHECIFWISVSFTEHKASIKSISGEIVVLRCEGGLQDHTQKMTVYLPNGTWFGEVNHATFLATNITTKIKQCSQFGDFQMPFTTFKLFGGANTFISPHKRGGGCVGARIFPGKCPSLHNKVIGMLALFKFYHSFYKLQDYAKPWIIPKSMPVATTPKPCYDEIWQSNIFRIVNVGREVDMTAYDNIICGSTGMVAAVAIEGIQSNATIFRDQYGREMFTRKEIDNSLWQVFDSVGTVYGYITTSQILDENRNKIMDQWRWRMQNCPDQFRFSYTSVVPGQDAVGGSLFLDNKSASVFLNLDPMVSVRNRVLIMCMAHNLANQYYKLNEMCSPVIDEYPYRQYV